MKNRSIYRPLLIVALIGFAGCSHESKMKDEVSVKPVVVTLSAVSSDSEHEILASGAIESAQTANISTRVMGRITNIYVKVGDRVHKGQLLAKVWDEDIKAKGAQTDAMIAEAEGAYANAQKDFDRFNSLYAQQSATAKELENVTLQFNSAKAKLAALKQMRSEINANLTYGSLTAPFSGVVTQKLSEVGSVANPGMPVFTIEQDGILQVSASIAESDISNVHLGDKCNVQIKSTGKSFDGSIIQVNPSSQFSPGQYIVKINVPEFARKNIYSGMFASINIPLKDNQQVKNDEILVPYSAIVNHDELTGIFTIGANHTALLRWLRLGKTYGDKIEVISGLSKNEKFINSSESKLYNGVPVVVKGIPEVSMVTTEK